MYEAHSIGPLGTIICAQWKVYQLLNTCPVNDEIWIENQLQNTLLLSFCYVIFFKRGRHTKKIKKINIWHSDKMLCNVILRTQHVEIKTLVLIKIKIKIKIIWV